MTYCYAAHATLKQCYRKLKLPSLVFCSSISTSCFEAQLIYMLMVFAIETSSHRIYYLTRSQEFLNCVTSAGQYTTIPINIFCLCNVRIQYLFYQKYFLTRCSQLSKLLKRKVIPVFLVVQFVCQPLGYTNERNIVMIVFTCISFRNGAEIPAITVSCRL